MVHEQDPSEAGNSESGIVSDEICPNCSDNVMTCDCIDDAAFEAYLKQRDKTKGPFKRYKDVNVKKKYL